MESLPGWFSFFFEGSGTDIIGCLFFAGVALVGGHKIRQAKKKKTVVTDTLPEFIDGRIGKDDDQD